MFMSGDQIRTLLHFSDDASADVFGRMAGDIPSDTDDRLRALASGALSSKERNYLLEELVDNPDLVSRLAQHLQDQLSREDQWFAPLSGRGTNSCNYASGRASFLVTALAGAPSSLFFVMTNDPA
jgi:hypothetical protein